MHILLFLGGWIPRTEVAFTLLSDTHIVSSSAGLYAGAVVRWMARKCRCVLGVQSCTASL